jgi:hypothetical protein
MAILICSLSMSRTLARNSGGVCLFHENFSISYSIGAAAACKKRELRCDDPADRVSGTFRELFQANIYI